MKKIIIVSIALLCGIVASAQTQFGIKGGANMANIIKTVIKVSESQSGVAMNHNPGFSGYAGLFGQVDLSDFIGVRAELLYSGNASAIPADILFLMTGLTQAKCYDIIQTLSLPIMATFTTAGDRLQFMVGPQLGYNISESLRTVDRNDRYKENVRNDYIKPITLSVALGANYLLGDNVGVEFRYAQGLTQIRNGKHFISEGYQTVLQLGVFYNFL